MISVGLSGSFNNLENFLKRMMKKDVYDALDRYGQAGVDALRSASPRDTNLMSESWYYVIQSDSKSYSITWCNDNVEDGFPVAIMLQYGHGTGTGGYVQGEDYINPAIKPIFDDIVEQLWKGVASS